MHYNKLSPIQNKKAAIELSIGTIVVIVIAMTMLIMGVVLVRNIFSGATDSVNDLNTKVKTEITNLFTEEGSKIAIKLGSTKLAKVKAGTTDFGIAVGARTNDNAEVVAGPASNLKYQLELVSAGSDCTAADFKAYMRDPVLDSTYKSSCLEFDDISGPNGYSVFLLNFPKGSPECTQKIKLTTYSGACQQANLIEQSTFRVQVVAGGIFS